MPQDHAPLVTEWKWPSAEELAGDVTNDQREAICGVVNGDSYKESAIANDCVGKAVAYGLHTDIEDEVQRKRVSMITKALIKWELLVKIEDHDLVQRKTMTFIRGA